jgi:hypothetical protein
MTVSWQQAAGVDGLSPQRVGFMMSALLIAGILSVLAGLLAIVYGIPVKEFSFGNTMILVGAAAICTGMLLLGLWIVVGELRNIARRLGPRTPAEARGRSALPPPSSAPPPRPAAAEGGFLFSRDDPAIQDAGGIETAAPPMSPHPWQDEGGSRERARPALGTIPEPLIESPPPPKPSRDRLFSSSRKDRDRTPRPVEPMVSDVRAAEATEAGSASFDDAWPRPERAKAGENGLQRRGARAPSTFKDLAGEDNAAVSIIKSGVVDGMAYSLYSDGSIEAQMPEGMMRFGSIDELRAHLDQR